MFPSSLVNEVIGGPSGIDCIIAQKTYIAYLHDLQIRLRNAGLKKLMLEYVCASPLPTKEDTWNEELSGYCDGVYYPKGHNKALFHLYGRYKKVNYITNLDDLAIRLDTHEGNSEDVVSALTKVLGYQPYLGKKWLDGTITTWWDREGGKCIEPQKSLLESIKNRLAPLIKSYIPNAQ